MTRRQNQNSTKLNSKMYRKMQKALCNCFSCCKNPVSQASDNNSFSHIHTDPNVVNIPIHTAKNALQKIPSTKSFEVSPEDNVLWNAAIPSITAGGIESNDALLRANETTSHPTDKPGAMILWKEDYSRVMPTVPEDTPSPFTFGKPEQKLINIPTADDNAELSKSDFQKLETIIFSSCTRQAFLETAASIDPVVLANGDSVLMQKYMESPLITAEIDAVASEGILTSRYTIPKENVICINADLVDANDESIDPEVVKSEDTTEVQCNAIQSIDVSIGDDIPHLIEGRWRRGAEIAFGGCGIIYEVEDVQTREMFVLKTELQSVVQPTVPNEIEVYKVLQKASPSSSSFEGLPRMIHNGTVGRYNFLIMDFVGDSLGEILDNPDCFLYPEFVFRFGVQALQRIEKLHSVGYVHCDIKPDNFLIETRNQNLTYLIDFGLSKKYLDEQGNHIKKSVSEFLPGMRIFASASVNSGSVHSRRDDLISLGYCLLYMLDVDLPWFHISECGGTAIKMDIWTSNCQKMTPLGDLCKDFPNMERFIESAVALGFEEEPNYEYFEMCLASGYH